mgnify:CR=1 FL=1
MLHHEQTYLCIFNYFVQERAAVNRFCVTWTAALTEAADAADVPVSSLRTASDAECTDRCGFA